MTPSPLVYADFSFISRRLSLFVVNLTPFFHETSRLDFNVILILNQDLRERIFQRLTQYVHEYMEEYRVFYMYV